MAIKSTKFDKSVEKSLPKTDKEQVLAIEPTAECKRDIESGYYIRVKSGEKYKKIFGGYCKSDESAWKMALHRLL